MVLGTLIFGAHVIVCLALVGLVLLQRPSSGGALGMGSGFSSQSSQSSIFTPIVTVLGFLLFVTSLSMAFLERDRISDLDALFAVEQSQEVEEAKEVEVPTS